MDIFKEAIAEAQAELSPKEFYTLYRLNHGAMSAIATLLDLSTDVKEDLDSTIELYTTVSIAEAIAETQEIEATNETKEAVASMSTDQMSLITNPIREILNKASTELKAPEFYVVLKVLEGSLEVYRKDIEVPEDFEKAISVMMEQTAAPVMRTLKDLGVSLPNGITGTIISDLEDMPPEVLEMIKEDLGELAEKVFPEEGEIDRHAITGILNHILLGKKDCETCLKKENCEHIRSKMSPDPVDIKGDPSLN